MTGIIIALLGVNTILLVVLALRRRHRPAPAPPPAHRPPTPELSEAERARLEHVASAAFEAAVQQATTRFGHDLAGTSERLNQLIVKLTTDIVERELDQYKQTLENARAEALKSFAAMQSAMTERQKSIQSDIDAAMAERRQQLLDRFDHKLGAAVAAYMVEALGQAADVGAQRRYLLESLERHKADLKREFSDEGE